MALKIYDKKLLSLQNLKEAYNEYDILKSLKSPNVIRTYGYYEDTDYVIIVQELMTMDLRMLLTKIETLLPEE